jgi:formiminotetrahydrofolate cyclodeaminase
VLINLEGIRDVGFKKDILTEAEAMMKRAETKCSEVLAILEDRSSG